MSFISVSVRSKTAVLLLSASLAGPACGPAETVHHETQPQRSAAAPLPPPPPSDGCEGVWCPCEQRPPEYACPGYDEVLVTTAAFGARGLFTSPSFLTNAPVGAVVEATNAVVDVPGEYTTRPGFERLAHGLPGNIPVSSWTVFQGRIVAVSVGLYGGRLFREDPSAPSGWAEYQGIYFPPSPGKDAHGAAIPGKIHFFEAQQALYFTTASGVFRLESLDGTPVLSGVAQALSGTLALSAAGSPQALNDGAATAYRYVWGRRAANDRVMLGAPSGRVTIVNTSGTPRDVTHSIPVPFGVDSSHFLQVYRADEVPSTTTPSDEMYLVHEKPFADMAVSITAHNITRHPDFGVTVVSTTAPHGLTQGQAITLNDIYARPSDRENFPPGIKFVDTVVGPTAFTYVSSGPAVASTGPFYFTSASQYTFTDTTPDALKADALYTNINFNSLGVGASHYRPPLANATAVFGERAFYGNVELVERVTLNLLGVGGTAGLSDGQGLQFLFGSNVVESYTGSTAGESFPTTFRIFTSGTPAQNVAETTKSLVRAINSRGDGRLYAQYASSDGALPGQIIVESRYLGRGSVTVEAIQRGDMWAPALTASMQVKPGNISRTTGNLVTVFPSSTTAGIGHGLVVGQVVELLPSGSPADRLNFPAGKKVITAVPTIDSFRYQEVGTPPGSTVTNISAMAFRSLHEPVTTDNEAAPGGWMASDAGNPDSVPFTIPEIAGDRYKRLYRFLHLGNSLFLLKEDGLFRLTGNSPETFDVTQVDSTVRFVAPDTAMAIGTRAYALTTQGLMSWTEATRPEPASVPVEDVFRELVDGNRALVERYAFAVNDDASRRAYFWLPDPANPEETGSSTVYVYHTLTDAWTRWDKQAATAMIHPVDGKLYVAPPYDFSTGQTLPPFRERRTGTDADYVDEDGSAITTTITHAPNYGPSPHLEKQWIWNTWHFRGEVPSLVDVGFSTNYDPTPIYFPITSDDTLEPGTVSTPPTMEHSRGRYLKVSIRHAQAGVPLRLLGYAVRSRHYEVR